MKTRCLLRMLVLLEKSVVVRVCVEMIILLRSRHNLIDSLVICVPLLHQTSKSHLDHTVWIMQLRKG